MSRQNEANRKSSPLNTAATELALTTAPDTRQFLAFGLMTLVAIVWFLAVSNSEIRNAELALSRGDYREALELSERELRSTPNSGRALAVASSACVALKDPAGAMAYLKHVPDSERTLISGVQSQLGWLAFEAGRVSDAEEWLRKSLETAPNQPITCDRLIYLLALEGRTWESRQLIFERLRSGTVNSNYLILISNRKLSLANPTEFATRCLAAVPNDPLPYLALANQAWRDNQPAKAREFLENVLRKYPRSVDANTLLLELLVETGTPEEIQQVGDCLSSSADDRSEVWLSKGVWAENQGQWKPAARCYWEALRRDPNIPRANYRLSQVLARQGMTEQALPFADRATRLTKLQLEIPVNTNEFNLDKIRSIVEQLEFLGRDWEAAGWCELVLQESGVRPDWASSTQCRLRRTLLSSESFTTTSKNPAYQLDLSQFPLPKHQNLNNQSHPRPPSINNDCTVAFQEEAAQTGLHFTYHNGASPGDSESMYEMNGGGVAVLDYDGDHWPDLFFTQGGRLPPASFDSSFSDQLFRNLGEDRGEHSAESRQNFLNVSSSAGIRDIGYGQGLAVGDFDNDGFPDLYVGNIGTNQLYHNNGDGTFSDITVQSGTGAGGWTSSCVFADLNQDGLPDLYVVTYLGDVAQRNCSKRRHPRCAPLDFPAEQDRCYLNLGDGQFRDVTETSGLVAPDGRGLGVVAADFDGSRRLSLFVANDMSANFFFGNQTTAPNAIKFEEQAILNGLAFDDQGISKACMGVAAEDYNGDGRLDLYVTNFYRQFNDFYVQQPDGSFRDLSRKANLADSSLFMLGWGTQFLDGDLDGHPDLIVTNGHVHDPLDPKIPYQMPAQFFRNLGNGTFSETGSGQLGEFFKRKLLGRSLVRLDWNRDGREDVCITHLNDPAALLTNRTDKPGNSLSIRLVGVASARDAIGARVRVSIGDKTWTRQLTAGDGFHASNERRLVFGLGAHKTAESVEVLWPSGTRQIFQNLELNGEWLLIEHRPNATKCRAIQRRAD